MLTAVGIALFWALWRWAHGRCNACPEARPHRARGPAPEGPPQPTPPVQWPEVTAAAYEYQPVRLQGQWLADKTVLTQATTALGAGYGC